MSAAPAENPWLNWATLGLPAFGSALAPWHDRIISAGLVSEWFQPSLNIAASVSGVFVSFAAYYYFKGRGKATLRKIVARSVAGFIVCLLACLALSKSLGVFIFPEGGWLPVVWAAWCLAYVAIFLCFSTGVVGGLLLARPR